MKKIILLPLLFIGFFNSVQSNKDLPYIFPEDLEIDIALSALPEHLRNDAGVYVYKRGKGYEMIKNSENGFVALVERVPGVPKAFAPVSFDSIGQATHMKKILEVGKWIEKGESAESISKMVKANFENGTFKEPSKIGISYMISPVNILPSPPNGEPALYYPHYMIYAPNSKPSDFGLPKFHWHSYAPMILDQGPLGLLVIRLGEKETEEIRANQKELISRVEKFLGKKLAEYEIAKNHNH